MAFTLALAFAACLFILVASLSDLTPGWALLVAALHVASWAAYGATVLADPGVLPRHVTAIADVAGAELGPPSCARYTPPPVFDIAPLWPALGGGGPRGGGEEGGLPHVRMIKFCLTCRIWRPPGAHHCSTCNSCVEGFDHHCDTVGKCVGAGNILLFRVFLWTLTANMWGSALYALCTITVGVVQQDIVGGGSAWEAEPVRDLWIAGGVLLSSLLLCACTGRPMRIAHGTVCGAFVITAWLVGGVTCLLVAYAQASSNRGRLTAALLSAPLFGYCAVSSSMVAVGMACMGKGGGREGSESAALTGGSVNPTPPGPPTGTASSSRCGRRRHVEWGGDARELVQAVQAVRSRLGREAAARVAAAEAREGAAEASVEVVLCSEGPDSSSGAQEKAEAQTSPASAWEAACSAALIASLDSPFYEGAARAIASDEGVCVAAGRTRGALAGLSFLVPGIDYDPDP